jgi:hypothetical protein
VGSRAINADLLHDLARHQAWADSAHWKALHEHDALLEDVEIQKRLNHMVNATRMLTALAQGETVDPSGLKDVEAAGQLESAMGKANSALSEALNAVDLQKMLALPRGPQGPGKAPAGVLLLQAIASITVARTRPGCGNWASLLR